MYPFIRLIKEFITHRNAPPLDLTGMHVSHHICWPWDLDIWMELNNGRSLSLYDLGRLPLARRAGLIAAMRKNNWGLTMAGASVRYRRRVRAFDRIEMRSRAVCWDERFIYLEQSMWVKGQPTSHILYRAAVTDAQGIVATRRLVEAFGIESAPPEIPDWIAAWITAEESRPWPPLMDLSQT